MHIGPFTSTTTRRVVIATLTVGGALVAGLTPAQARWQVHNSSDVTQIVAPAGGNEKQTCTDRLRGQSGWSTDVAVGEEPETKAPPPDSGAYGQVTYDVWKAPRGYSSGFFLDSDTGSGVDFFPDGLDPVPAVFVTQFTTPPRAAITPEYVYPDEVQTEGSNLYLYSFVGWSALMPGLARGDLLGMRPPGFSTFVELTAIHCDATKRHIHFVRYNPAGPDTNTNTVLNQETVVVANGTAQAWALGGWTLRDNDGQVYRFPTTRLEPGQSLTVHTGKGTNRTGHRYWGRTSHVWDNGGEEALLRNSAGARVDSCRWGTGPGFVNC